MIKVLFHPETKCPFEAAAYYVYVFTASAKPKLPINVKYF